MLRKLNPVSMKNVQITGGLLGDRMRTNALVTAPLIYERCAETGRVQALKAEKWDGREQTRPHPFWDSDIGKMVESAAYSLQTMPNPGLVRQVDAVADLLEKAQQPDGYLNTYFQATEPEDARFRNLYYMHELYCAGHLIEGAVAWYQMTGKRKMLDVMCRYANLLCSVFRDGDGGHPGYCGHPEIELALVRLYEITGQIRYLELSRRFIDRRGRQPYFFEEESLARGVDTTKTANQKRHLKYYLESRGPYAEYQSHKPVREQTEPVGHAVRAMYLYSGMADIADYFEDRELAEACRRLWQSVTNTQYAITGGIGPSSDGERFTFAYDLPNEITYNESCASVALVMWAGRMLQLDADGRYADIIEQTLYNTVLGSVSQTGDKFFYANYLSVYPLRFEHSSKAVIDKMRAERQPWFDVSCCPPNICRLIGALGGYVASTAECRIFLHQYTGCTIHCDCDGATLTLTVKTAYPWDGRITVAVECQGIIEATLLPRIPGWCDRYTVQVNGAPIQAAAQTGYFPITRAWQSGDIVVLNFDMPPVLMQANPRIRENCGKTAIMRGPVVYCLEEADNGAEIANVCIDPAAATAEETGRLPFAPDAVCLRLKGIRLSGSSEGDTPLYRKADFAQAPGEIIAVPYYLWGNRGFGEMQVWSQTILQSQPYNQ